MSEDMNSLVAHVEAWETKRHMAEGATTTKQLNEFVEVMNYHTRQMLSVIGRERGAAFFSALKELAANAERITEQRKVFVDKQDATALGM